MKPGCSSHLHLPVLHSRSCSSPGSQPCSVVSDLFLSVHGSRTRGDGLTLHHARVFFSKRVIRHWHCCSGRWGGGGSPSLKVIQSSGDVALRDVGHCGVVWRVGVGRGGLGGLFQPQRVHEPMVLLVLPWRTQPKPLNCLLHLPKEKKTIAKGKDATFWSPIH